MRLGLNLGYLAPGPLAPQLDRVRALATAAEDAGYDSVWTSEAYGSDAFTVLAWLAAHTTRVGLGTAIAQIPARTPAMTAMTAATLDAISGGRFRLGLGVSGPQVSEGWHGVAFAGPLARTREYVHIVRSVLRRERVTAPGPHFPLPLPDGPGKPLRLAITPERPDVPVYLAAVGPANIELATHIADGWLAVLCAPDSLAEQLPAAPVGFDVVATVPMVADENDDVAACVDAVRPHLALYIGGMGSAKENFYHRQATRLGHGEAADEIQRLFLSGDTAGAAAAVPAALVERLALLGSRARVAARMAEYAAAGVTTLAISPMGPPHTHTETVRLAARALTDTHDTGAHG